MDKMEQRQKTNKNKKYSKPVSLYGIKSEIALDLFMKIKPKSEKCGDSRLSSA